MTVHAALLALAAAGFVAVYSVLAMAAVILAFGGPGDRNGGIDGQ